MKRVDFFYDFSCPYAYLGHTQIEAVCARAGAELVWRPMLLGGVFRAIGTPDVPAATMPAAKARMNALDMQRWAAHFGVPLAMPEGHPNRSVLALRAAIASSDVARASKALFRAYWVDALDVSRPEVVKSALDGAGFDGAALALRAEDAAIKDELRRRTDEAIAAGVFGAPAFVVTAPGREPELFWGQDRLELVEDALAGRSRSASDLVAGAFGGAPHTVGSAPRASGEVRAASPPPSDGAREVSFYFDFSSPFAYLGATQIEAVAARHGARVRYRPFLLGALFKAIGTPDVPIFTMPAAKQTHYRNDMLRWAARYGAPFHFPSRFPMNSVKALRVVHQLDGDDVPRAVAAIFRAYWAEDRDIASDDVLADIASSLGLDGARLVAGTTRDEVKRRLRDVTEEAERVGVCGAPCFLVGDQLFWGQDRLQFVERALRFDG